MSAIPPQVRFVLATIVIDAIGFGIIMPVMPDLLMEVGGLDVSAAARFGGLLSLLYAAFQFVIGPTLGNLGDRFGRRPVLLGSLVGYSVNFALMAAAPNLGWLLVGQALAGVFGGTYGPAQAALADISAPADRARIFGYVGAAFGIGFTLGPAIGGLLGEYGPRMPFYAAAALAALNFIYGLTIFPETLAFENRRAFDWRRANPLGAFRSLGKLPGIIPIGIVLLLWQIASLVYPLTWGYYLIASFGATPQIIGISLMFVGVSMTIVQMFVTGRCVSRFGEKQTAMIGLAAASLAFTGFAIAPHFLPALLLGLAMPFGSLVQPALSALISQRGQANNQGEIQGFTASVMSVGAMIGPVTLNPVLAHFTTPHAGLIIPGAAFILTTLITMTALMAVSRIAIGRSGDEASNRGDNLVSH